MTNKKRRNWREGEKGGKNRAKRSRREEEGGETDWTVTPSPEGVELEDMALQLCSCWTLHLCIFVFLLRNISSAPSSRYILNHNKLSFNNAAKKCPGGSVLTTIATQQEVDEILKLIFKSEPFQNGFTFWVGLRITSSECIDRSKPLRGFKWLENNSEESEVSQWAEDPEHTCTTDRCVALKGQFDGLNVTWGLIPLNCHKDKNAFICKVKDGDTTIKLGSEQPPPGDTPTKPPPPEDTPTKPPSPEDTPIKPSKPKREPGFINDSHSAELRSCQRPSIPEARSLKMLSGNTKIQVQCWSSVSFDLVCSGEPTVWRLENGALANITAIKIECANATQKEEDSVLRLTILLPVLIATGVLVFLLVVIAVTVKCYLNRRSKKRAIKKAEKMEMKSKNRKDSFSLA